MITGNIITLNESANIVECIESLKLICDEIIVVDSLSSDDTKALAEKCGAKVVEQSYLGDGPQKNVVKAHASNDWIFSLDADERLTPELAEEIKALPLASSEADGYAVKRKTYIGSRWMKQCGWYPDYLTRLYHKDRAGYSDSKAHSSVQAEKIVNLEHAITHQSFDSISDLFGKGGRTYYSRSAKIMYLAGKKAHPLAPFFHGTHAFFKHYILRRGFLAGLDGLTVCFSIGLYSYMKYAKLIEFHRDSRVCDQENFDSVW